MSTADLIFFMACIIGLSVFVIWVFQPKKKKMDDDLVLKTEEEVFRRRIASAAKRQEVRRARRSTTRVIERDRNVDNSGFVTGLVVGELLGSHPRNSDDYASPSIDTSSNSISPGGGDFGGGGASGSWDSSSSSSSGDGS